MSEKLKTRSELMAELEKVCQAMRPYFEKAEVVENGDHLHIATICYYGKEVYNQCVYSTPIQYRPDPVAPAKWKPVFFYSNDTLGFGVSAGELSDDGIFLKVLWGNIESWKSNWCNVNNRDHHSTGWRKEWEPTE